MQIITIEESKFNQIVQSIEEIKSKLNEQKEITPLNETWLDNQEVCTLLFCSKRQLQHYRDSGKLPFSKLVGKIYYKASDIDAFLESGYNGKKVA